MNYWFATMHAISAVRLERQHERPTRVAKGTRQRRRGGVEGSGLLESDVHVQNRMAEEVKAAIATDVAFMEREQAHRLLHDGRAALSRRRETGTLGPGDGAGATSAEENGVPPSPGHRRRRSGTASFGGSSGGNTGGALAHFSTRRRRRRRARFRIRKSATSERRKRTERTPPRDRTRSISRVRSRSPRRTTRVCNFSSARSRRRSA